MQEMIFGIGPNPMFEQFEDEDNDYKDDAIRVSPFHVYLTDKKTWDEKHCCNDSAVDNGMNEKLNKAGFAEAMESIFESDDASLSKEQIHEIIVALGYVYNEEFSSWMASVMG